MGYYIYLLVISVYLLGSAASAVQAQTSEYFTWGGDFRARVANFDRIPKEDGRIWTENRYFRFRSRVWGRYAFSPDVAFQVRLINEWRTYEGNKGVNQYRPMDEFVFDNFFVDVNNLFDKKFDIRIGRQDMQYGTGKIIRQGTPYDSSRTYYLNAAKGRFRFSRDITADVFGIYQEAEDEFAMNNEDRSLIEGDEAGGGIYFINKRSKMIPQEYYYVFKKENRSQDLDLHTFGLRLNPTLTENFSLNVEAAIQDGSRENGGDVDGELFDFSLYFKPAFFAGAKLTADLNYYYLSGDDLTTLKEEGWHNVWARYPQFMSYTIVRSLVSGSENFASWSNISMPSVGASFDLGDKIKIFLRYGRMYAPEKGPGGGKEKGSLYIARINYKLTEKWDGNIHLEVMDPDSYYSSINGNAHYAHFDLMFHF